MSKKLFAWLFVIVVSILMIIKLISSGITDTAGLLLGLFIIIVTTFKIATSKIRSGYSNADDSSK
ncbi:hypothetical protein ACVRWB_06330 [Streptococcus troglodytae]|uniref:Uncharacterized protein n=1 Tax=Streptococcus troglodytae TaxID=1111760 RepID=A0A1L7LGM7_9STRE|nr:hypothetical protein [Streptococcus troglodytae]BAQ23290.1 putative uncharacterized protein [Streptococcus troglodytae]